MTRAYRPLLEAIGLTYPRSLDCLGGTDLEATHCIQLAYFHGLTYTGVAAHLGIPHSTAKTRIRDGLRSLANGLDPSVPGT